MLASPEATQQLRIAAQAHDLVRDLHTPDPRIYWTDLVLTGAVGWVSFAAAVLFRTWSWQMLTALFICSCALYRGLCFLHEISHIRGGLLRGFELAWNMIFGIGLLLPSFMYVGVHQYHHSLVTYGTDRDPEYLPFAGKPFMITVFVVQGLLIPAFLLIRFLVLAPVSLLIPAVHRVLCTCFSSLCLNVRFRRDVTAELERDIRRWEIVTLISWAGVGAVLVIDHVVWRCLLTWYAAFAGVAVVNTIRTLGAHRYSSDGIPIARDAQLIDSIDTPGAVWTELWAPVGLRYHALHHYFPGIPYHNLSTAYGRLIEGLPPYAWYHQTVSPGLPHSLRLLYSGRAPEFLRDPRYFESYRAAGHKLPNRPPVASTECPTDTADSQPVPIRPEALRNMRGRDRLRQVSRDHMSKKSHKSEPGP
jgi:fatty acid desaturase